MDVPVEQSEKIVLRVIDEEMRSSYLAYSMSVIVGRALPDARDGLKPVHRRILYSMQELALWHNKPFKKCARVVGDCLGKFHPHGDVAVYDSLVRMAQDFSLRYPLVQGQGNFGSVDGDSPAAMRYTEARLNPLSEEMLRDLEKDTVDFVPNFDGSLKEPAVMPAVVPNLLVNGSSGIAVGMATNIPPHNLREVCTGMMQLIDAPNMSVDELMRVIPGPDFPTGGVIQGVQGIRSAYASGRGRVTVRGKVEMEGSEQKKKVVIKEIPYLVNKALLVKEIAQLVNDKVIRGVRDLRDESDKKGLRVVLDLSAGANEEVVINQLFSHTRLQDTFSVMLLAVVDNQPRVLSLRELMQVFVDHRKRVVVRRTEFELREAEEKSHILEGLLVALAHIDEVIVLIKSSSDPKAAAQVLMSDYSLSEKQVQAILDMKLQRLTSLEQGKIREEQERLLVLIKELRVILSSDARVLGIIKSELQELCAKYGDDRRTGIVHDEAESFNDLELIKDEDVVVTISKAGYVKRLSVDNYRKQKRGGQGVIGADMKEADVIDNVFVARTHDVLLFFTNVGKLHWLHVHQVPEAGRYARGTAVVNLVQLQQGERVTSCISVRSFGDTEFLFMVTKQGVVKKTELSNFAKPRKGGIIAMGLPEGDELVGTFVTSGKDKILIATKQGMAVRFGEDEVRSMGRNAMGVIGIRLREGDMVVSAMKVQEGLSVLTLTEKGFGKRSAVDEYRLTRRGGVGVINIKITEKNGCVVAVRQVRDSDEVILITEQGIALRTGVKSISVIGRNTQGVRVMKMQGNDKVVSVALVESEDENSGAHA